MILPALTSAAARGTDNRVEFESEVLIFQLLLLCGGGNKERKGNKMKRIKTNSMLQKGLLMVENG